MWIDLNAPLDFAILNDNASISLTFSFVPACSGFAIFQMNRSRALHDSVMVAYNCHHNSIRRCRALWRFDALIGVDDDERRSCDFIQIITDRDDEMNRAIVQIRFSVCFVTVAVLLVFQFVECHRIAHITRVACTATAIINDVLCLILDTGVFCSFISVKRATCWKRRCRLWLMNRKIMK